MVLSTRICSRVFFKHSVNYLFSAKLQLALYLEVEYKPFFINFELNSTNFLILIGHYSCGSQRPCRRDIPRSRAFFRVEDDEYLH